MAEPWLRKLLSQAETYVFQLFGDSLAASAVAAQPLPFFLADKYRFAKCRLLGKACTLMAVPAAQMETPANLEKHWQQARALLGPEILVVLTDALSFQNRQRLLARRVPFMVPGNQLFIPELATDLREHFRTISPSPDGSDRPTRLTPAAQFLVLGAILGEPIGDRSPAHLSRRFPYSPMSMGRAFDELQTLKLAEIRDVGRERRIHFKQGGRDLWDNAFRLLQSPVRKTRFVARPPETIAALLAGESALAHYTDLSPSRLETRAVAARAWRTISDRFPAPLDPPSGADDPEAPFKLETWAYDPALLSAGHAVDRLSLYLSLEDRRDERVDQAAAALLDGMSW